ncbi:MAG: chemotaxis protein CheB [Bdellovibrionaceae bacterium]|nr:chemotaxis protein CheB [Pseudobdellovibrionaceae bacterium]
MARALKHVLAIGCSAGGTEALRHLFMRRIVPENVAVIVVLHVGTVSPDILLDFLRVITNCPVNEAESQEPILGGRIYFAPPGYHLLVSPEGNFELNVDDPVNYSRPSIDVLFESAAEAFKEKVVAVVLTGANHDGAAGAARIMALGGQVLIQSPNEAEHPQMPLAAMEATRVKKSYFLNEMAAALEQKGLIEKKH